MRNASKCPPAHQRARAVPSFPVVTLLERMHFVLKSKGWSGREWARRAGLSEENHVNALMLRMKNDAEGRLAGDIETYAKLAKAAGVSLDWLVLGRGVPVGDAIEVSDDPRYPSRARVVVVAYWLGFPEAVIRAVLDHDAPSVDPGPDYWLRLLQLKQAELAAPGAAPTPKLLK
jgi:transcriptional regulator with XRE-family HTH domain